jgi:hypothetical protein
MNPEYLLVHKVRKLENKTKPKYTHMPNYWDVSQGHSNKLKRLLMAKAGIFCGKHK